MASERIFAQIPTRHGEEVRIAFSPFKDKVYIAIRAWFTDNSGELRPSNRGINLAVAHLPAIAVAINKGGRE